jgi:N-acetylglucosamine malate deacetylase 1
MSEAVRELGRTPGPWLIVAPHMDDETLGCGMLLADRDAAQPVHVIFASDGRLSPPLPPGDGGLADLAERRQAEARAALAEFGLPAEAAEFLGFPDGGLTANRQALQSALLARIKALRPAHVLVPFRYDRHPDHLAVNRAVSALRAANAIEAQVWEYFVYSQWRLLPSGDVRTHLRREDLFSTFSEVAAARKRRALECHRSQTTLLSPAQGRPILTAALLNRVCGEPEVLLRQRTDLPGRKVLQGSRWWIPVAHRLEPALKRLKDRLVMVA